MIEEARMAIAEGRRREDEAEAKAAAARQGGASADGEREGPTPAAEGSRRREVSNSRLGEARVSELPRAREWLARALEERFFPLLESRFGGGSEDSVVRASDLTLHDALIIGYIGPCRSQPVHRDASLLSLNVALSSREDYAGGGGTYFEALDPAEHNPVMNERGHVLTHCGGIMHAGNGIETGERWVLVLFVIAKNEPQLARRCHAMGLNFAEDGELEKARGAFEAGLSLAPNDHLLRQSLGRVHSKRNNQREARRCLNVAARDYRNCHASSITLGKMLTELRRPRAALRRFDEVLSRMNDADLREGAWTPLKAEGWEARLWAARCAVLCAEAVSRGGGAKGKHNDWSLRKLPEALERISVALRAAPTDDRLLWLQKRAGELLEEAERRA